MKRVSPRERKRIIALGEKYLQALGLQNPVCTSVSGKRLCYQAIGSARMASSVFRETLATKPRRSHEENGAICRTYTTEEGVVKLKYNPQSLKLFDNARIISVEFHKLP